MEQKTIDKHRRLRLILRFFHGSKRYFAAAAAASFASAMLNALTPQIFRFTVDEVLGGEGFLCLLLWCIQWYFTA